jgi:hypothetical protein
LPTPSNRFEWHDRPYDQAGFFALLQEGAASCAQCHAPKNHGPDFTQGHGEVAEHGGGRTCQTCHRGADRLAPAERLQVQAFQEARLRLIQNPEDEKAFNQILPPNFCAHCHGLDGKAWKRGD